MCPPQWSEHVEGHTPYGKVVDMSVQYCSCKKSGIHDHTCHSKCISLSHTCSGYRCKLDSWNFLRNRFKNCADLSSQRRVTCRRFHVTCGVACCRMSRQTTYHAVPRLPDRLRWTRCHVSLPPSGPRKSRAHLHPLLRGGSTGYKTLPVGWSRFSLVFIMNTKLPSGRRTLRMSASTLVRACSWK